MGDPQGVDTLIDLAPLARPGDDAAAVDQGLHTVGGAVFLDEEFGSQLGCAVE